MSRTTPQYHDVAPTNDRMDSLPAPVKSARPHPWEMIAHPFKTIAFIKALAEDRRISMLRKILYVGPIILLLGALLLPESILAAVVAVALPVVGPVANLPADGVVDWAFIGLAAYALLGILPKAIVSEHHARLFHPGRIAKQRRQQGR
ncbi:MAG: hypothetical protein ACLQUY_24595 [Ktedonobacterales bacterium]|jgi:hypothetical protein